MDVQANSQKAGELFTDSEEETKVLKWGDVIQSQGCHNQLALLSTRITSNDRFYLGEGRVTAIPVCSQEGCRSFPRLSGRDIIPSTRIAAGRKMHNVGPLIFESSGAEKRVSTGALEALNDPLVVQTKI